MSLKEKVAIVTGSSRGIGAAIAIELGSQGASVVVNYTSPSSKSKADEVVDSIKAKGSNAVAVQCDVAANEAGKILVDAALTLGSGIDILINNAGYDEELLLKDITIPGLDKIIGINLRGPILITQAVVNHIRPGGSIVNVSSILARIGMDMETVYSATKAGLEGLTRTWAVELGQRYGITCNAINPGPVSTDMWWKAPEEWLKEAEPFIAKTPAAPRIAESATDIAPIVSFLCSKEARWITGNVTCANGGLVTH